MKDSIKFHFVIEKHNYSYEFGKNIVDYVKSMGYILWPEGCFPEKPLEELLNYVSKPIMSYELETTNKSTMAFSKGNKKVFLKLDSTDGYYSHSMYNFSKFSLSGYSNSSSKKDEESLYNELIKISKYLWTYSSAHAYYAVADRSKLIWDIEGGGPEYSLAADINENHFVGKSYSHPTIHKFYWFNIFGPTFTKHYGEDFLLSLPAYKTEKVKNGVLVQLAPTPFSKNIEMEKEKLAKLMEKVNK